MRSLGFAPAAALLLPILLPAQLRLDQLKPLEVIPLKTKVHHVQGIDVEGSRLWVSAVDRAAKKGFLFLIDLPSGNLVHGVNVQEGERIHPGGMALDGDSIWLPVAEYRPGGTSTIERRDKHSLSLRSRFTVADHIGCVAVARDWIAGGNWDARQIYFWDRTGRLERRVDNPHRNAYQDLKAAGGMLIGSGKISPNEGGIDWLQPETLRLSRRLLTGRTDRGVLFTNEGMTLRAGKLYLLPEDDPSRLFVYEAPR